jgi:hypothetical protein
MHVINPPFVEQWTNMKHVRKCALTPGCSTKVGMKWGKQNAEKENQMKSNAYSDKKLLP